MRLLSKNIISVAILLASSLKTLARPVTSKHPIELKGVGSLISANQVINFFFFLFINN